ncbi:MAG: MBL fold metallo-hydrolase [Deferribacteraceae bacterium]|jgi:phosphoribosyl 1,2-cyclic phosphodiesterase|nr:MBL fold metallo-hydrolase [Deferribacteraceae bacterium]
MRLHTLASGSSGNSYCVETDNELIFVDIGVPVSAIKTLLSTIPTGKNISLLLTHEHTDHIKGLVPFVNYLQPRIYSSIGTAEIISEFVPAELIFPLEADQSQYIGGFGVTPFNVSHDAAEPFGYVIMTPNCNVGVMTDLGHVTKEQIEQLKHVDFLILEANHDKDMLRKGKYPHYLKRRIAGAKGHISNDEAVSTLVSLQDSAVKRCLFAHVSEENNDYEILDRLAAFCTENYGIYTQVLRQKGCAGGVYSL